MPTATLTHPDRPWTVNSERAGSGRGIGGHHGRAKLTEEWRGVFHLLADEAGLPSGEFELRKTDKGMKLVCVKGGVSAVRITVEQTTKTAVAPDPGSTYPAVKAAIDGLVDYGFIEDDRGEFVHRLTFLPPVKTGTDSLSLTLEWDE